MRKAQRAAEEGGRPHDQHARACLEDAALALELGLSVHRKRRRLVRLDVWLVVSPVEDEVGREMDQRRALAPANDGDEKRTLRVDRERLVGFRLGTVDGVVGGAVEDHLRLAGRDQDLADCRTLLPQTRIRTRLQAQRVLDRYLLPEAQQDEAETIASSLDVLFGSESAGEP